MTLDKALNKLFNDVKKIVSPKRKRKSVKKRRSKTSKRKRSRSSKKKRSLVKCNCGKKCNKKTCSCRCKTCS